MRRLALLLLVLIGLSGALLADQIVTHPWAGVARIERVETLPRPLHMHVVQIDLAAPGLRFKLSPSSGSREAVRQTTLDFLKQEGAQVAINAHFFLPFPSTDTDAWLIGIAASDGRVYSAFESPEQTYAIVADAPGLNIDADNHAAIVHRDTRQSDARRVSEAVTLWTTVAGSAQIVTDGKATIPAYEDATHPGAPLTPGGPNAYGNDRSWCDVLTARSAIGLSRDQRTLTLFTVDVRGGSEGMRIGEVAEVLLKDYGVWNALNLDGGVS